MGQRQSGQNGGTSDGSQAVGDVGHVGILAVSVLESNRHQALHAKRHGKPFAHWKIAN
jgi:hypothetical protein